MSVATSVRLYYSAPLLANAFGRDKKPAVTRVPPFVAYDIGDNIVALEKGQKHLLLSVPPQRDAQTQVDPHIWTAFARDRIAVRPYCLSAMCETSLLESSGIVVARNAEWRAQRLLARLFSESPVILLDGDGRIAGRTDWRTLTSQHAVQRWLSELERVR